VRLIEIAVMRECMLGGEESMFAAEGVINQLVRDHQATSHHARSDATHCINGNDVRHTQIFQCPYIGAEVDAMRRNGVLCSMPRQKPDHTGRCLLFDDTNRFGSKRC